MTVTAMPLAVPAEMLQRAAELLDVLHTIERRLATSSTNAECDEYASRCALSVNRIEQILAGVDPVEVREIQTVLAAFATLNRRAAA